MLQNNENTLYFKEKIQNINNMMKVVTESGYQIPSISAAGIAIFHLTQAIVNGNVKDILNLLWAYVVAFEISNMYYNHASGIEALILWCQENTAPYDNVLISDFSRR